MESERRKLPPNAGKGRPKGAPNKITKAAREAFELAFEEIGGSAALAKWARKHQTEFYKLYARLIPIEQHIGGPEGNPEVHVRFVDWPVVAHSLERQP